MDYTEQIRRGAELLDIKLPGWRGRVNTEGLDMQSGCYCVLGYVFGFYEDGCFVLGLDRISERVAHGFSMGFTGSEQDYHNLTMQWRAFLLGGAQ